MLDQITPVILTYNEAPNIERTLEALQWAKRIVVMDSFSSDETADLCRKFANVDFVQREFDQHARQWNAAIGQDIQSEWVLALDADYVLSNSLIDELRDLQPPQDIAGYWASFTYKIRGKALRGSLYPPVVVLYRNGSGEYKQDGHTQRIDINGQLGSLEHSIYHDDRKSRQRWLSSQRKYAKQEAEKLAGTAFKHMSLQDRLRYLGLAPLIILPYTLVVKGTILDGLPGLEYAWQRFIAEFYLQSARFSGKS